MVWRNRNQELCKFWLLWKFLKKQQRITWEEFTTKFSDFTNFSQKIDQVLVEVNQQLSLFDDGKFDGNEFSTNVLKMEEKLAKDQIYSIVKEDFDQFPSIAGVKANWFFYKGDINILKNDANSFVSVIGSRKTPSTAKDWISQVLPKDKIIISGLATGADTMGHIVSIERKQKIVVFPGLDIYNLHFKDQQRNQILEYAKNKGLILTDLFPDSNSFDKTVFLKRNKWMAQMSSETYVVYFKEISGTIGQMTESIKLGKKIFLPKEVLELNQSFFNSHKGFLRWDKYIEARD